jgi:hypothetical protein
MATQPKRDIAELCRAIEAICNRGELDIADALFAPDYINHGGLIPDLVHGPEALKVAVALYRAAFPNFSMTLEPLRTRGSVVLLRWTARQRPTVNQDDAPPARAVGVVTGIARGRLVGDQIAESWTRWDAPRALRQLGLAATY